jgi:hypothetical protein
VEVTQVCAELSDTIKCLGVQCVLGSAGWPCGMDIIVQHTDTPHEHAGTFLFLMAV